MVHLLTDDVINKVCEYVENGSAFLNAYVLSGVNARTGTHYRTVGIKDIKNGDVDTLEARLVHNMDVSKAKYISRLADKVEKASNNPDCWGAAMTLLERRDPKNYSKNPVVENINYNPELTALEQIAEISKQVAMGNMPSEEGLRQAQILGTMIKAEIDTEINPLLSLLEELKVKEMQKNKRR